MTGEKPKTGARKTRAAPAEEAAKPEPDREKTAHRKPGEPAKVRQGISVLEKKENPLLKRQEVWVAFSHHGAATPRRQEIVDKIAAELKADKKRVILDKIFGFRGRAESKAKVLVYKSEGDIPKAKKDKMERRLGMKEAEKKEETAAAKPEGAENAAGE